MFSSITIRINPFNIEYYFVLLELVETTFVFGSRMYVSGSITNRVGNHRELQITKVSHPNK